MGFKGFLITFLNSRFFVRILFGFKFLFTFFFGFGFRVVVEGN